MPSDWLFSTAELQRSPSRLDGVSLVAELERRSAACRLIARLASTLRLSLASQRAACVFLHRFFMRRSLAQVDASKAAAACLLLASKAENDETQGVDVARLARALISSTSSELATSQLSRDVLQLEGDVLLALSFELEVDHSFSHIAAEVDKVVAVSQGNAELRQKLKQTAWSFLNDSAITWTCLAVDAPLAAKAAVYAAGLFQDCVSKEPGTQQRNEPWWTVLDTPKDVLTDAARHVLSAYTAPFVDTSALPNALVQLVNVFHAKTQTNESSECCVRDAEVPETDVYAPLDDDFKQVEMDAEVVFQDVDCSPVSDEAFVDQTTAWLDDCVVLMNAQGKNEQSLSSPSDPFDVEKSLPLYSPQNRAMEPFTQGSLLLKRSITLADSGRSAKKVRLAL